jgi:hypothetical protein
MGLSRTEAADRERVGGLGGDKLKETPKDGRWATMTVHSEAVRQAKEYLDIGFVVNAIKRPDGVKIAHDQEQLSALYQRTWP